MVMSVSCVTGSVLCALLAVQLDGAAAAELDAPLHKKSVPVPPDSAYIRYTGRVLDAPDGAAGVRFDTQGTKIELRVLIGPQHSAGPCRLHLRMAAMQPQQGFEPDYFGLSVNGEMRNASWMSTFNTSASVNGTMHSYNLGTLRTGGATISVVKLTEPQWNARTPAPNYVTFGGFDLACDDVQTVHLPARRKRRIEFLGDSITAGYCNLCDWDGFPKPQDMSSAESFERGWPHAICTALDAECHINAWSGYGMVMNCCGGTTVMPTVYRRTLATVPGSEGDWNWASWVPDAVVINLGTNDGLGHRPYLLPNYTAAYAQLAANITGYYGVATKIFMACGPMDSAYCAVAQALAANLTNGVFLDQRNFLNGTFGQSCCGHPGTTVDAAMGKAGAAAIGEVLRWR